MIPTLVLRPPYPSAWVRAACVVSCARRKARLACQHIASLVTAPLLQVLILSRKLEDGHLSSSTTHRVGGGERDRARPASTCRPASMDESSLLGPDDGLDEYHQQLTQQTADIVGLSDKLLGQGKAFMDPVHGLFKLPDFAIALVDTPQFQRLRDLKQLGLTYLVFPGASHNRFEHSLGTAYLAWSVAARLYLLQGRELQLDKMDVAVATMAGLCHDLGHGPFSHVFDNELLPRLGVKGFSHEEMSGRLFDNAVEAAIESQSAGSRWLESMREDRPRDFAIVKAMIANGKGSHGRSAAPHGRRYLFDIVSNSTNSIDVDKFDYIMRDSYHTGVKASFELKPVAATMKICDDEIAFRSSQVHNLYELFHSRSSLHRRVYTHPKAKAMEYMVVDALEEASDFLQLREKTQDARSFVQLDDTLLKRIEWYEGDDARMQRARGIVQRLRRRDIYTCCGDIIVPKEMVSNFRDILAQDVVNSCDGVSPSEVIVHNLKIDFAMNQQNPLENVKFYESGSDGARTMPMCSMSTMYVTEPIERRVRVFLKSRDPEKVKALEQSFKEWGNKTYGKQHFVTATPAKGASPSLPGIDRKRPFQDLAHGNGAAARRKVF